MVPADVPEAKPRVLMRIQQSASMEFQDLINHSYFRNLSSKLLFASLFVPVTDKGMGVCVDPGGNGVTMNKGAEGGPSPPGGE